MNKPNDIPHEFWVTAENAFDTMLANHPSEVWRDDSIATIARAIMGETDRIAAMAEEFGMVAGEPALVTFAVIIRGTA